MFVRWKNDDQDARIIPNTVGFYFLYFSGNSFLPPTQTLNIPQSTDFNINVDVLAAFRSIFQEHGINLEVNPIVISFCQMRPGLWASKATLDRWRKKNYIVESCKPSDMLVTEGFRVHSTSSIIPSWGKKCFCRCLLRSFSKTAKWTTWYLLVGRCCQNQFPMNV